MKTLSRLFDLRGRVAVVTGGAGLLGVQHGEILSQAGAHVVVADVDAAAAEKAAIRLTKRSGIKALGVGADIADVDAVLRMVARALSAFKRLDILVNNAAMTVRGGARGAGNYFAPFETYPLGLWERALAVNLTGAFNCCQAAGRQMLKQGQGVIINIASIYGVTGPDQRIYRGSRNPHDPGKPLNTPISYAASKAALLGMTRYLAAYWAGKGIRVNALSPGGVFDGHGETFVKQYAARTILGRMAKKDEYKGAVLFLASDASSYMTGANLLVDGGWTAW